MGCVGGLHRLPLGCVRRVPAGTLSLGDKVVFDALNRFALRPSGESDSPMLPDMGMDSRVTRLRYDTFDLVGLRYSTGRDQTVALFLHGSEQPRPTDAWRIAD